MEILNQASRYVWRSGLLWMLCFLCSVDESRGLDYVKEKPAFIKTCKIYEPQFTKCSTESIQQLMTEVTKGIPEIEKEIGSLDPLKLDKLIFNQDNSEVATLKATLTDVIATGLSKVVIKESRVSKKDFSWLTKIYLPVFKLEGHYKMDGRILLLPLNGEGHMVIEIDGMDVTLRTKTRLFEKGGFTFYNVTEVKADLHITKLRTQFDDLFGGNNKEVERSTNESFNQNWQEFFEALRPLITETVEEVMHNILHKIFLFYPANFIVGDIPTSEKLYGKKE